MTEQRPFEKAAIPQSDRGKRLKQRDYLPEGRIPVIDQGRALVGGFTDDEDMAFVGEFPVILFGDHTRAVKYVERQFAVGADGVKIFRPAPDISPRYLFYWMQSAKIPDRGYGRHYQYLRQLTVPVPTTIEQDAIVAEIEKQFSRLDEAVANLKRVKANLKRYKAAVLNAAVDGRLVPTEAEFARKEGRTYEAGGDLLQRIRETRRSHWKGRGKYKEPGTPCTDNLNKLPDGWVWASVESLSMKVTDGVHKKPNYLPAGIPFVTVRNLTAGAGISFEELNYVSVDDHAEFCKRTNPERGDILISKDGTLGVIRLVETDRPFSIFVSVALVKPVSAQLSRYLVTAFESPVVQRQMVPKGSGLQHIHLEDLRADCIPFPPSAEQQRIVAEVDRRLSLVRGVETEVGVNLQRAAALKRSILHKAFRGATTP